MPSGKLPKSEILRLKKLEKERINEVHKFVSVLERRNGICSLEDINNIITYWYLITRMSYMYDRMNTVSQIEHMWLDLKLYSRGDLKFDSDDDK